MFRSFYFFISGVMFFALLVFSPMTTSALLAVAVSPNDGQTSAASAAPTEPPSGTSEKANVPDSAKSIETMDEACFVTTLAGSAGVTGFADGTGDSALFDSLTGIAVDTLGNLYALDIMNNLIRKITPEGVVTTLAGSVGSNGFVDGTGSAASFNFPTGIAVDNSGNVYVADRWNHAVRKITPEGMVTTLAGSGKPGRANGTGKDASFNQPDGIAVDNAGNLYVADMCNNLIRKISVSGVVTTLAGSAGVTGSTNGTGTSASFFYPTDVAVDSKGNVYVADADNNKIRKITPGGLVTTLAGTGKEGHNDGAGTQATFKCPLKIAVDASGNLYVSDRDNFLIRKISSGGMVTTLAGSGTLEFADGAGNKVMFRDANGIAVDSAGNIYIAQIEVVRKIQFGPMPAGLLKPAESISAEIKKGKKAEAAKKEAQAKVWYLKAAEKGSAEAQYRLAEVYVNDNLILTTAAMAGALWAKDHPLVKNDPRFNANAKEILKWTKMSADENYAPAQKLLGDIYAGEQNTPELQDEVSWVNQTEAMKWYEKAAAQGNAAAKQKLRDLKVKMTPTAAPADNKILGTQCAEMAVAREMQRDFKDEIKWLKKGAKLGDPQCQEMLGANYETGHGVSKNLKEAREWYQKAADQGNAEAEDKIGSMYFHGKGFAKDHSKAFAWYQKAANQGNADAEDMVGDFYWTGDVVSKDIQQAQIWFKKACDQNDMGACTSLSAIYMMSNPK